MNNSEKERIIEWYRRGCNFAEGVEIYQELGCNLRLKREFALGATPLLVDTLKDQLLYLAGIEEKEMNRLIMQKRQAQAIKPAYPEAGESLKEILRIRDRFPFLKDENCPDQLKIMVADMFTAYDSYKEAHQALLDNPDTDAEGAYAECKKAVENFKLNRDIWDILEYYKEHGALPEGVEDKEQSPEEEIANLSDLDLSSKLKSAVANESKHKKAVREAEEKGEKSEKSEIQLQYWSNRKKALKEEIEKRKKK